MLFSDAWKTALEAWPDLRAHDDGDDGGGGDLLRRRSLLAATPGTLFVWNDGRLFAVNTSLAAAARDGSSTVDRQLVLCSPHPLFPVLRILASPSGRFLALVGERSISVLALPVVGRGGRLGVRGADEVIGVTTPVGQAFANHLGATV